MTALIGYARVAKANGSQVHDLQRDALRMAGVDPEHTYEDAALAGATIVPGLRPASRRCAAATRSRCGNWLGRDLRHLVNLVGDLTQRNVGLKVLSGEGVSIDTTRPTASWCLPSSPAWTSSSAS